MPIELKVVFARRACFEMHFDLEHIRLGQLTVQEDL